MLQCLAYVACRLAKTRPRATAAVDPPELFLEKLHAFEASEARTEACERLLSESFSFSSSFLLFFSFPSSFFLFSFFLPSFFSFPSLLPSFSCSFSSSFLFCLSFHFLGLLGRGARVAQAEAACCSRGSFSTLPGKERKRADCLSPPVGRRKSIESFLASWGVQCEDAGLPTWSRCDAHPLSVLNCACGQFYALSAAISHSLPGLKGSASFAEDEKR